MNTIRRTSLVVTAFGIILLRTSISPGVPGFVQVGNTNRLSEVFLSIEDSEYEIHWQARVNAFQSPNRAQNLRFTYFDTGFAAQRRAPREVSDVWSLELHLQSFGNPNAARGLGVAELAIDRKSASATHAGIKIEYFNDRDGMRQNFVLDHPQGRGGLRLNIAAFLHGVEMGVADQGDYVAFFNELEEVMRYGDLKVWDAKGNVLPAEFEAVDPNHFAIVVDDSGAEYPIVVDPLSYYWTGVGGQSYAQYGFSVAYGNFEGGVGDVIVGAPYFDSGNADEGKVFVYYGNDQSIPTTPSWTGESDQDYAHFGWSVAAANVNGDAYDDLIVGSPDYSVATESSHEGKVFVWLGVSAGTGLGANGHPVNASWSKTGEISNAKFGFCVASARDVNNDGYKDIIIGAPHSNDTYQNGKVYVYHGSSSGLSTTANWTATLDPTYDQEFGWSVASAGDVNGDGYGDIIIGAPHYSNGQTAEGVALIWHGSSTGVTPNPGTRSNVARVLEKNQASASFGYAVASGDVNGDGYSDVIVGAPLYDNGQSNEGAVFVYHGSSSGIPATENWYAESDQAGAQLGFSLAAQDLTFPVDGYADIIVGAPYFDYIYADCGMVFVWYGSSTGLGPPSPGIASPTDPAYNADKSIYNVRANANAGWSVAAGPNLTYFIHPGLIIGAPNDTNGGSAPAGSAIIFLEP